MSAPTKKKTAKVLCIHGVGRRLPDGTWQSFWKDALISATVGLEEEIVLEPHFFTYDDHFKKFKLSTLGTLEAVAKLSVSGVVYGFDDLFRSRDRRSPREPNSRAARGVKDRLRWTAGMVVQWAENEKLRSNLRRDLAKTIEELNPDFIFAHSLGSLIAYDTFHSPEHKKLCADRVFVSFGSQIGNPFVRSQFCRAPAASRLRLLVSPLQRPRRYLYGTNPDFRS